MTVKQRFLKALYPGFIKLTKALGMQSSVEHNAHQIIPPQSVYELSITLNNGMLFPLMKLKGKKILIVNTASACGYTAQYSQLQELYEKNSLR